MVEPDDVIFTTCGFNRPIISEIPLLSQAECIVVSNWNMETENNSFIGLTHYRVVSLKHYREIVATADCAFKPVILVNIELLIEDDLIIILHTSQCFRAITRGSSNSNRHFSRVNDGKRTIGRCDGNYKVWTFSASNTSVRLDFPFMPFVIHVFQYAHIPKLNVASILANATRDLNDQFRANHTDKCTFLEIKLLIEAARIAFLCLNIHSICAFASFDSNHHLAERVLDGKPSNGVIRQDAVT
mmetsp:Transcript_13031/g.28281  ORF Transcript_13031/g.28281 Transcript_13031/m.28281 type:complete len:243 (+) Transcript_13031:1615-2343(+)